MTDDDGRRQNAGDLKSKKILFSFSLKFQVVNFKSNIQVE